MIIIKRLARTLLALSASIIALPVLAKIELPPLMSDGAVIQRDRIITLQGEATPNESVAVAFGSHSQLVKSNAYGVWSVEFPSHAYGGPYTLVVSTRFDSVTINDILIGDVWVASGQSNMEWPLKNTLNAEAAISKSQNTNIRHFKVPRSWASAAQTSLTGGNWLAASPATAGDFSAIGYYFAQRIYDQTHVPIGIINSTWGGSSIEAWMSPKALGIQQNDIQQAIDAFANETRQQQKVLMKLLQRWPNTLVKNPKAAATTRWNEVPLDTHDWLSVYVPRLWENQGYTGMDGVAWYRTSFTLTADEAADSVILGLGKIDDRDTTWVNGIQVGTTNAYDVIRQYGIPESQLIAGENVIAIRVEDYGGGGGIYGNDDALFIETKTGNRVALAGQWQFKPEQVVISEDMDMNQVDTALFNKMLNPLFEMPVAGIIWYQGESNANNIERANKYGAQFQTLITDWRMRWKNNDLPFYWVQLASFNSKSDSDQGSPWAIVRDGQGAALALPKTGQAVSIDVGDSNDIHPKNKHTVGYRLANIALKDTYGIDNIHTRGPAVNDITVDANNIIIHFKADRGLAIGNNSLTVSGFEVETKSGMLVKTEGSLSGTRVILPVKAPADVLGIRYAWQDDPLDANLIDTQGWPAEPFNRKLQVEKSNEPN